jgi:hypothetical protein
MCGTVIFTVLPPLQQINKGIDSGDNASLSCMFIKTDQQMGNLAAAAVSLHQVDGKRVSSAGKRHQRYDPINSGSKVVGRP